MTGVVHVLALTERPGRLVWAGAERQLRMLLPALATAGTSVEAVVLATDRGPVVDQGLAEWRRAGVAVTLVDRRRTRGRLASALRVAAQYLALVQLLRRRRERVVHLHQDVFGMVLAARLAGCRHAVFTLHNEMPLPARGPRQALTRAWMRLVARWVACWVGITARVRERLEALLGRGAGPVTVLEYGCRVEPRGRLRREDLGWPADGFLVGFVGRLVFEKNVMVLLEALARAPELRAVLVGDGPLRGEVERFVASRGLRNVVLAGGMEDASRVIPLLDVLCLPSVYEGLGLVLLEAMLHGVPVAGSRAGAIPDILGGGIHGLLFDPHDPDAVVATLRRVRDRPAETRARADEARRYAEARFSLATAAQRTQALYARLVGANGRR